MENRVLRRIFGPRRDEVTGEWRKLHNELNNLYSASNIFRVIKWRRMRLAGHVSRLGESIGLYRIWWGNRKERGHLEDSDIDGKIILRCIFREWDVVVWIGSSWLRIGTGGGHLLLR
jgi:hypothetical protein